MDTISRIMAKVKVSDTPHLTLGTPCWEWQGVRKKPPGLPYGRISVCNKLESVHRVMYELTFGVVPDGLNVLHKCDNPPCCNPDHLVTGTQAENCDDCIAKGRWPTGDNHWTKKRPELMPKGQDHWSKRLPDRQARGAKHGTKTHPEKIRRGERHHNVKLTDRQVAEIRSLKGKIIQTKLAEMFGVSRGQIQHIHQNRQRISPPNVP